MVGGFYQTEKTEFGQDLTYFVREDDFKVLNSEKLVQVGFGPRGMKAHVTEYILREHGAN